MTDRFACDYRRDHHPNNQHQHHNLPRNLRQHNQRPQSAGGRAASGGSLCRVQRWPRWPMASVSLTSSLILLISMMQIVVVVIQLADCKPIEPNNAKLNHDHEGLLVDLLNKQQSGFLSQLQATNQIPTSKHQLAATTIQHPRPTKHQASARWVPVGEHEERRQLPSLLGASLGPGAGLVGLQQQQDSIKVAESSKTMAASASQANESGCDKKRQARNLDRIQSTQQANGTPSANVVDRLNKDLSLDSSSSRPTTQQSNGKTQSGNSNDDNVSNNNNEDEYDKDDDNEQEYGDEGDEKANNKNTTADKPSKSTSTREDLLDGRESVAHGSAMVPPLPTQSSDDEHEQFSSPSNNQGRSSSGPTTNGDSSEDDEPEGGGDQESSGNRQQDDTPDAEMAERRELEAAEASEAEAADRSALAEQQQQQREIILAQAQSEAKAIREQQEALLKQQQLQQQMLMRRHQNFLDDESKSQQQQQQRSDRQQDRKHRQQQLNDGGDDEREQARQQHRTRTSRPKHYRMGTAQSTNQQQHIQRQQQPQHERTLPPVWRGRNRQMMEESTNRDQSGQLYDDGRPMHQVDNQFSDQPDNGIVDRGTSSSTRPASRQQQLDSENQADAPAADELGNGEDSIRQPQYERETAAVVEDSSSLGARLNLTASSDLIAAAQHHHYGIHYGSLDGHHGGFGGYVGGYEGGGHHKKKLGGYHQYASSHKKGQFDTGFKRGNKKFVISGRSSQHKGHAEGHVKWSGKKGKGSHHWDYKHKNKKHYGGGYGYGGGHHYY